MAKPAELRSRLNLIDAMLASGATSITVDGVVTQISQSELRKERTRIERLLPEVQKTRKPAAYRVNLGG